MNVTQVVRTITIKGVSDGVEKVTSDVNKLAAAQQNVAVVSEQSARRVLSLEDAWKKQTLKLDEAARSQANIARETKIADNYLREGNITQQQHAERLNLIAQRYAVATVQAGKFANQTGLNRYEVLNLSRQLQDVGVSLAGGQSPFVVLAQQGSQIFDVFQQTTGSVRGFFSQAISWGARFATSAAGVATGITAIGAGALYAASSWQEGQRDIERALIGIGKQSGVTVKDINSIASSSATTFGLSVDQAREAALEFVKTGAIYKDNIKAATDATYNFSIVTGQGAKEAAQELAKSLASPLEGADALNTKLGFLDGRTREYIATLVSQNQKQEAQAVLLRNLTPAIQDATNTLGPFEKAWDAVANAAIRAKNAIGQAITPQTDEQRRDALVGIVNRRSAPMLEGTPVDTRGLDKSKIAAARQEIEVLNERLRETARARALAFEGDRKISLDADQAVRELLPYIDQLKKVEEQLNKIKAARESSGAGDRQGLAGSNNAAVQAAEVLKMNIQATADETARANAAALQLAEHYKTGSLEVAKIRAALDDQLMVAQAVGGQARLSAQEAANYNELIRQGKSIEDATAIAAQQRAVAQAQINAQAQETTFSLQNQLPVAQAITGAARMAAQEQATYNQLVHDAVAPELAAAQAAAQRANSLAQVNAEADKLLKNLQQQGQLLQASSDFDRDRIQAAQTYRGLLEKNVNADKARAVAMQQLSNADFSRRAREDAEAARDAAQATQDRARAAEQAAAAAEREAAAAAEAQRRWDQAAQALKFIPFYLLDAMHVAEGLEAVLSSLYDSKQGGKSQFNPEGYKFTTQQGPLVTYTPNDIANNLLASGASSYDAFNKLLEDSLLKVTTSPDGSKMPTATLDTERLQALDQLRALMPQDQQADAIKREWMALSTLSPSIERDTQMKTLVDALTQLTQATDQNTSATSAMTDVLSPYYSQDPRRTHLGFRAFAGGGIMTPWGEVPLHKYDGGGIASSPQMAMFGEGSTPEAYVPVPSGRIPVEVRQPANSNTPRTLPPINLTVNVMGDVSPDKAKRTGFQIAQSARRTIAATG